jgi:hypothetical protein
VQLQKPRSRLVIAVDIRPSSRPGVTLLDNQIYQERRDNSGSDVGDWLEAERQLNETAK